MVPVDRRFCITRKELDLYQIQMNLKAVKPHTIETENDVPDRRQSRKTSRILEETRDCTRRSQLQNCPSSYGKSVGRLLINYFPVKRLNTRSNFPGSSSDSVDIFSLSLFGNDWGQDLPVSSPHDNGLLPLLNSVFPHRRVGVAV